MEIDLIVNVTHVQSPPHSRRESTDNQTMSLSIPETIITSVLLSIITISTIIGNVLVILSVFTYKPLRIAQNFFLVSLAVADLTVAVLVMPFNIVHILSEKWMFGIPLCKMWLTCDVLCCTASILNLCAIAMDRYWAIHDPINYAQKRTLKRVVVMILLVWTISGVICLPPLIGWNDWPNDFHFTDIFRCTLNSQRGYIIYSSCGSFFIPLIVMTTVYLKIFVATKRRFRERAKAMAAVAIAHLPTNSSTKFQTIVQTTSMLSQKIETNHNNSLYHEDVINVDAETPQDDSSHGHPLEDESLSDVQHLHKEDSKQSEHSPIHQFIEERQKISLSKESRAARILGIVMGVFVVCWLPFFVMYVVVPFCQQTCSLSYRLEIFITWLGYINSALNPIIYTIFNVDFRRAFVKLLRCRSQ